MRRVTSVEELVSDPKTIVVTEGEFDAMAVYQATGFPAVSLPCGAKYATFGVLMKGSHCPSRVVSLFFSLWCPSAT